MGLPPSDDGFSHLISIWSFDLDAHSGFPGAPGASEIKIN